MFFNGKEELGLINSFTLIGTRNFSPFLSPLKKRNAPENLHLHDPNHYSFLERDAADTRIDPLMPLTSTSTEVLAHVVP